MDRTALTLLVTLLTTGAFADSLERRVRVAREVVDNRMDSALPIPSVVHERAKCIASMKVVKVGLIWGGEGSTGLVSCRTAEGWSAPSFFNIGGVSWGIQIGVQFMESVLVFMTDHSREILERGTFKIGADISFAAGPVGQGIDAGKIPEAEVLTYQRSVGLYAGATINGLILSHAPERNSKVYGKKMPAWEILAMPGDEAPALVQPFVQTLEKYSP